eukprot:COSAG01_NODE_422_length_17262_cov_42.635903_12_plen_222_part_00
MPPQARQRLHAAPAADVELAPLGAAHLPGLQSTAVVDELPPGRQRVPHRPELARQDLPHAADQQRQRLLAPPPTPARKISRAAAQNSGVAISPRRSAAMRCLSSSSCPSPSCARAVWLKSLCALARRALALALLVDCLPAFPPPEAAAAVPPSAIAAHQEDEAACPALSQVKKSLKQACWRPATAEVRCYTALRLSVVGGFPSVAPPLAGLLPLPLLPLVR